MSAIASFGIFKDEGSGVTRIYVLDMLRMLAEVGAAMLSFSLL